MRRPTGATLTGYVIGACISVFVLLRFLDYYPLLLVADLALLFLSVILRVIFPRLRVKGRPSHFDDLFIGALIGYLIPLTILFVIVFVRAVVALLSL